ncbi:GntR family transcriptional regulator [Alkalihalobacterium chitinilyticum]|uniref:GntR family transcriptional regulator n=1 Tax=Alkalihalobacterium chitinilyticum TaxID=2980103 RepID=A0ABT5VE67_9BACI|nr:GntR family transcriptional regulator [Alkalihalobacterium chitinilyticum]MDE5413748.1 GntR family transcriptional regulator [Alkalihalobacterium chitinilyticum]
MWIHLSNESKDPLYKQLKDQIKQQIIDGTLEGDTELPSIRTLAKNIQTSVITVKRAYSELEQEEFLYTRAGRGTFVKATEKRILQQKVEKQFETEVDRLFQLGASLGLSIEEMMTIIQRLKEERK